MRLSAKQSVDYPLEKRCDKQEKSLITVRIVAKNNEDDP